MTAKKSEYLLKMRSYSMMALFNKVHSQQDCIVYMCYIIMFTFTKLNLSVIEFCFWAYIIQALPVIERCLMELTFKIKWKTAYLLYLDMLQSKRGTWLYLYLFSSCLKRARRWTSSGPSANLSMISMRNRLRAGERGR